MGHSPDSQAPAGAGANWLPDDDWVMRHWLPYDESRLYALLQIDRKQLQRWLHDDSHTIAQLAAQHGHDDVDALAAELLQPRRDADQYATLLARTKDTLTQGHLAQHAFFHLFHDPQLPRSAQTLFGVSTKRFRALRQQGRTPRQIAAAGGRSATQLQTAMRQFLEAEQRVGQREGAVTAAQSKAILAAQLAQVPKWLDRKPKPKAMAMAKMS